MLPECTQTSKQPRDVLYLQFVQFSCSSVLKFFTFSVSSEYCKRSGVVRSCEFSASRALLAPRNVHLLRTLPLPFFVQFSDPFSRRKCKSSKLQNQIAQIPNSNRLKRQTRSRQAYSESHLSLSKNGISEIDRRIRLFI